MLSDARDGAQGLGSWSVVMRGTLLKGIRDLPLHGDRGGLEWFRALPKKDLFLSPVEFVITQKGMNVPQGTCSEEKPWRDGRME